ncbi:hypothetical protein G6F60_013840 [Rhizopus arrhizus]|nr:hypothetical protein G6F60_013840 [Rhizopus arrhizus]
MDAEPLPRKPMPPRGEVVLKAVDVTRKFGGLVANNAMNLEIRAGEILALIGPNGAGKTTLLSAIMGVLPSTGQIVFGGKAQAHAEIEEMVAAGMNLVPEKRELFAEMTVEDNLMLGAFHRFRCGLRDQDKTLAEVYELFPRLTERHAQLAGTLSGGERQMLAVGPWGWRRASCGKCSASSHGCARWACRSC